MSYSREWAKQRATAMSNETLSSWLSDNLDELARPASLAGFCLLEVRDRVARSNAKAWWCFAVGACLGFILAGVLML